MNLEKSLWLDISEKCTGWSVFDNGVLINFGSFVANGSNFGEQLSTFHEHVVSLLNIFSPDVIGIEDIYAQNITTYKILAGLQAIAVYSAYRYNKCVPLLLCAATIRKYEKLNIKTSNYKEKFPTHDFSNFVNIRLYDGVYYDITNPEHLKILSTTLKNGTSKVLGSKIKEFDYAKKQLIVDRVNMYFGDIIKKLNDGKLLTYCENDIADAIYSNFIMLKYIVED
jgi:hypothetical protein